jgi:uncharacterized SAM-binding protein YcdF (DUF218 family)
MRARVLRPYPGGVNAPAVVVLGNTSTRMCRRLVAAAERLARDARAELVVFSGWSGEAALMHELWRGPSEAEVVLEEAAATTAQNASLTLPILLERGVTQALVVCAPTHLPRARWIFRRIYVRHGVSVRFAVARALPTPGALLWELVALGLAARQIRGELERR